MSRDGPAQPDPQATTAPTGGGPGESIVAHPESSVAGHAIPSPEFAYAACPGCGKSIRLERQRLRPGRFRLRCGACHQLFLLSVSENLEFQAERLVAPGPGTARPPRHEDELPPELAATLGIDRPAPRAQPARTVPKTRQASARATLGPGESAAGLSGSHVALSGESAGGLKVYDATSQPDSVGPGEPRLLPAPDSAASSAARGLSGERLGGYELQKKLGEGGMGAVYLARQVSLDRNVALKVLSPKLSRLPALVGRFMREAYAAGQLVHHNVVQIYDFGKDKPRRVTADEESSGGGDVHFFSMEYVDGATLQKYVQDRGRLEPKEAVSLILQAARGLAFAHDHGIIHRDIKPDNLMLNRQGVVKVADLGLVKQLGIPEGVIPTGDDGGATLPLPDSGSISAAAAAHLTQAAAVMGTPAYMPPEQAQDARSADARADIYSLGCTLYHLLVGRPPFGGRTLQEVIDAHRTQKLEFPDPAIGGPKLSGRLREIVRRMCSKDPAERFRSMDRVAGELERYLAEKHHASAAPDEQQTKTLQWAADQFNRSGWFRARPLIISGYLAVVLAAIGAVWFSAVSSTGQEDALINPFLAFGIIGGLLGMCVLSFVFGFVLAGARRRDVLFVKARQLVFGAGPVDWLLAITALTLLVVALVSFGWHWWWLGAAVLALGLAWLWQAVVDRGVRTDQQPMVVRAERVLREMREAGIEETRIRGAVAESAGRYWEAFYESLFGYEAKLDARRSFGIDDKGREKPYYAAWRDPILSWLNDRLERRRLKRDRAYLKSIHKNELLAHGVKPEIADKQAGSQALREVGKAALMREQILAELRSELRAEAVREHQQKHPEAAPEGEEEETPEERERKARRRKIKYTDDDFERIHESYFKRRFGTPLDILLGQKVRFALAAILIVCFALWFNQNQEAIFGTRGDDQASLTVQARAPSDEGGAQQLDLRIFGPTEPVALAGLDPGLTRWISGFHVGLAGMLLAIGAFFYGRALGVITLLSAAVMVVGPPLVANWWWVPVLVGAVLWAMAVFFLRVSDD